MKKPLISALALAAIGFAHAQVTIDGSLDPAEGYQQLAVQTQVTQWGAQNSLANIHFEQSTKFLNLFIGGRVNGNAMLIFIDSKSGGISTIGDQLIQSGGFEADINNLGTSSNTGMTFEAGFEPDYAIRVFGAGDEAYASLYDLQRGFRTDLGRIDTTGGALGSHGPVVGIRAEWSDVDTNDHAAADKGMEISLNMALLGVPEGNHDVRLMAMIVNSDSTFGSNQVLGSLDTNDVIGGDLNGTNFGSDYASTQTLTVTVDRPALLPNDDEDGDGIPSSEDPFPLAQTRDITFSVNMAVQEAQGLFTPGSTVQVQFFSGSQEPLSTLTLSDDNSDLIYVGTLADAQGFENESFGTYKFITDDPNSPNSGFEFGFDRTFNLGPPEVPMVLDTVFFSNDDEFPPQGFDNWIAGFFPGETDPDIIGPDADPDGDGFSNLAEFLFGSDPTQPTGSLTTLGTSGSGEIVLSWLQRDSGALYALLESTTMEQGSWDISSLVPTLSSDQTGVPEGYSRYEVEIPVSSARMFFRVEAIDEDMEVAL